MNNIIEKIRSTLTRLKPYRWLLLPVVPLILLLFFLVTLFTQPSPPSQQVILPTPTSIPLLDPIQGEDWGDNNSEWEENPETRSGFEKKEERTDGTTVYFYTSLKADRPNITIRNPDNSIVFHREQGTEELPLMKIPLIKETYGEPDEIIKGSTYFGPQAEIYFYESINTTYVVNPSTSETYEVHFFPPMSAEEYLQRYKALN
jgi:hypothetical protein